METRLDRLKSSLAMVMAAMWLASCGGGGSGGDSDPPPSDTARLKCQVLDNSSRKAVADAKVTYQSPSTSYTTQTDGNGKCELDMPAADVAGVKYPAASVTKTGYEPQTILCNSLKAGETCSQEVYLIPLASNMSIPVGGDTVMHLGDGLFEGSVNSQFQKASDGTELVFPIADWAEKVKIPGVTTATVYVDAKGWQSDICNNVIELSGDAGTQTLRGGVSPAEGYWAGGRQVPFVFSVAKVGTAKASLRITSGTCNDSTDMDDFEINRIRVEFN